MVFFIILGAYLIFRVWSLNQKGKAMILMDKAYQEGLRQGQAEQNRKQAEFQAFRQQRAQQAQPTRTLKVLGLSKMPRDIDELEKARRNAMFAAHPDRGGSNEQVFEITDAYEQVRRTIDAIDALPFEDAA